MSGHAFNQVFMECDVCRHPQVSHATGECFCGCTGRRAAPAPRPVDEPMAREAVAVGYERYANGWSQQEDLLLEDRYGRGAVISELSDLHGRRPSQIITRLEQLGLREPRWRV